MKLDARIVTDMNVTIEYHCSDVMMLVWPMGRQDCSGYEPFPICRAAFAKVMDGLAAL